MSTERDQVVVIGGGFGGLNVAKALANADIDVTLVDRTSHHLFQPLLYQVATGILPDGLIAPALRNVIKDQTNARALLAEVLDIYLDGHRVSAAGPDRKPLAMAYDTLVMAAGALPEHPEVFVLGEHGLAETSSPASHNLLFKRASTSGS